MNLLNQRWNGGRDSYRPAGEVIDPTQYDVVPIKTDSVAKAFILKHHYSGSYPAARFRHGLYRHGELVGVAVFSHPCSNRVLTKVFPLKDAKEAVELGRLVLLDEIPGNAESFFIARCFQLLKPEGIVGVVSFSDPVPRRTANGRVILPGHCGIVYQATNGTYLGRGDGRVLKILPDGTSFNHRAEQKIRRREQGWRYAADRLEAFGADPLTESMDSAVWLETWLPQLTRPLRHRGNHKYAWGFHRAMRKALPLSRPYPKQVDVA